MTVRRGRRMTVWDAVTRRRFNREAAAAKAHDAAIDWSHDGADPIPDVESTDEPEQSVGRQTHWKVKPAKDGDP